MIFTGGLSMLFLEVGENFTDWEPTQVHKNSKNTHRNGRICLHEYDSKFGNSGLL